MPNKKFKTKSLYKASRNGKYFHVICDGKGPTVSLFKIKDIQQLVGGFTSA